MLKLKPCSVALACLSAAALAGCDTGEPERAQPTQEIDTDAIEVTLPATIEESFAGDDIPDVTLTHPSGSSLKLADTDGAPVLLNLWATWCAPCIKEMPLLDELAGEVEGQVRVLTVSMDLQGAEAVEPFFEEYRFANLPRWMDTENQLGRAFGGGAVLPLTVLYDAKGKEMWRVIGAYDWSSEEARAKVLEAVLNGAEED